MKVARIMLRGALCGRLGAQMWAAATILLVAGIFVGCAKDGGTSLSGQLPEEVVQSGFRLQEHAFSFPNFGGKDSKARLNAEGMVRLFGEASVCAEVTDGKCRLTPLAKTWMQDTNEAMVGGRCEGFAVLSGLMYLGAIRPVDLGASSARGLQLDDNDPLKAEISYWFSTQFLRSVVATSTKAMTARDAVAFFTERFRKGGEVFRLGIVRVDEQGRATGGHAITPLAVGPGDGEGKYVIRVYDNNFPESEREIRIDSNANRWEYQASTNPNEPAALYAGDPSNGNLLYVAPVTPRKGVHPCPFCAGETGGSEGMSQVLTFGSVQATVGDGKGGVVGMKDGKFVNTMPGGHVAPVFTNLWVDNSPTIIYSATYSTAVVDIQNRGDGSEAGGLTVVSGGQVTGLTYTSGNSNRQDSMEFDSASGGVSFKLSSTTGTEVFLGQELSNGDQVVVNVALPDGANVGGVVIGVDPNTGNAKLEVTAEGDVDVVLTVAKSTSEGEGEFTGQLSAPAGGSVELDVKDWDGGDGELSAKIDKDGDGVVDEVVAVPVAEKTGQAPLSPTSLVAQVVDGTSVRLGWVDRAVSETAYEVQRHSGGGFAQIASLAANSVEYVDSEVVAGKSYTYRVRAKNEAGESAWSEEVTVAISACPEGQQDYDGDGVCSATCKASGMNCGANGACADSSGAAVCVCNEGYAGEACASCAAGWQDNDKDGVCTKNCANAGVQCGANGACSDGSGTAQCMCNEGYAGVACASCAAGWQDNDKDGECRKNCATAGVQCGANGACADGSGTALCVCNEGYTGGACEVCATGWQDNDKDGVCTKNCANAGVQCGANGACSDGSGTAQCVCDEGYAGVACESCAAGWQDNDEDGICKKNCATAGVQCGANGACSDGSGSALCVCNEGYAGAACESCAIGWQDNDKDGVCQKNCAKAAVQCGANGACSDGSGTAQCVCDEGYAGTACESCATGWQDNDEDGICKKNCATAGVQCGANGACTDGSGSALCVCNEGYAGAACESCATGWQDNDENGVCQKNCATSGIQCGVNGACSDGSGIAQCVCNVGYAGVACESCAIGWQDNDDNGICKQNCATADVQCGTNGACSDASGTAQCNCDEGHAGTACESCASGWQDHDENGVCQKNCATSGIQCGVNGACSDGSGIAQCVCNEGYTGATCESCAAGFVAEAIGGVCVLDCSGQPCGDCDGAGCFDDDLDGGGWTPLTAAVAASLDPSSLKEYMFLAQGRWFITPATTIPWRWDMGIELPGRYRGFNGEQYFDFICEGSWQEQPQRGVGCSAGLGNQPKVLPIDPANPAEGKIGICQGPAAALPGESCVHEVEVMVRDKGPCVTCQVPRLSCQAHLEAIGPQAPTGRYTIDPDGELGPAMPHVAFCDMQRDGGGWTLALKVDGHSAEFLYDSPNWSSHELLSPASMEPDTDEAKLLPFVNAGFDAVRVEFAYQGVRRGLVLEAEATSLRDVFASGAHLPTSAGREAWLALLPSSKLQPFCDREGFNVDPGGGGPLNRVRLGIVGNEQDDCDSPDSRLGIGGQGWACLTNDLNAAGNEAECLPDGGWASIRTFAYVWVRCTGPSCEGCFPGSRNPDCGQPQQCPPGTVPGPFGDCEPEGQECPPGSIPNSFGGCEPSAQCEPGFAPNAFGGCDPLFCQGPGIFDAEGICANAGVGYFSPDGSSARYPCTNAPANAIYTSAAAFDDVCPWVCKENFIAEVGGCYEYPGLSHLKCAPDEAVVGVFGQSGWWLDAVGLRCATLHLGQLTGEVRTVGPVGGDSGGPFAFDCAPGEVAHRLIASNGEGCGWGHMADVGLDCVHLETGIVTHRGATSTMCGAGPWAPPFQCAPGEFINGFTYDGWATADYMGMAHGPICY